MKAGGDLGFHEDVSVEKHKHCSVDEVCSPLAETLKSVRVNGADGSIKCKGDRGIGKENPSVSAEAREFGAEFQGPACVDIVPPSLLKKGCKTRASSVPPRAARSVESGPWSLEWLSDQHHGEAGVISSLRKKFKKARRPSIDSTKSGLIVKKRKKVDGVLRHYVHSLKKVARLPCMDRSSVLKILKNRVRKRQGSARLKKGVDVVALSKSNSPSSSSSVNNDWSNWVVMHGVDKVAVEDVWGIGKAIRLQFKGDTVTPTFV